LKNSEIFEGLGMPGVQNSTIDTEAWEFWTDQSRQKSFLPSASPVSEYAGQRISWFSTPRGNA
jgi:hypothetical protein